MFATKLDPVRDGREPRASRRRDGARPSDRCLGRGSGARRTCARSGPRRACARRATCACHAATGSGSSSLTAVATASQSRSTSGSPNTLVAQPPVGYAIADQLQRPPGQRQAGLGDLAHPRAPQARAVDAVEEPGLRVADDREQRPAARRRDRSSRCTSHGGDQSRLSSRRALGLGTADVLVAVVARRRSVAPASVRLRSDRPRQRRVLERERSRKSCWPGLQVHPDPHREPRIGRQHLGVRLHRTQGTRPLSTLRRMGRLGLAVVGVGLLLFVAGCGGKTTYSLDRSKTCLTERGVRVGGKLDFVAGTATGGAFVAHLGDNFVTVAFGEQPEERHRHRERLHPLRGAEHPLRDHRRPPPLQQRRHPLAQAPVRQRPRADRRLPPLSLRGYPFAAPRGCSSMVEP